MEQGGKNICAGSANGFLHSLCSTLFLQRTEAKPVVLPY